MVLKMGRLVILISIILLLPACSLVGMKFGEELDRSLADGPEDLHQYESYYLVEGLKWDIEIAKAILSQPEQEPEFIVDTGPCIQPNTIQVCSIRQGCSCEKYIKSHYNTLEIR